MTLGSYLIQMVTDGDLTVAEITADGPRFEYTKQGRAKLRRRERKGVRLSAVAGIAAASILLVACLTIDVLLVVHTWFSN